MEGQEALHEILEELHITSLDDSDLEAAGLNDAFSDDAGSAASSRRLGEETSTDSGMSAEIDATLRHDIGPWDVPRGDLEHRLRLGLTSAATDTLHSQALSS